MNIKFKIIGTTRYQLHKISVEDKYTWGVWSIKNQIYLKDTTAFGRENISSELRLVGIVFDDGRREKIYIKDLIKNLKGSSINE
ncbi:MAG: hypothetical protein ACRC0K_00480 [Fusobacteriaceae bacterium]